MRALRQPYNYPGTVAITSNWALLFLGLQHTLLRSPPHPLLSIPQPYHCLLARKGNPLPTYLCVQYVYPGAKRCVGKANKQDACFLAGPADMQAQIWARNPKPNQLIHLSPQRIHGRTVLCWLFPLAPPIWVWRDPQDASVKSIVGPGRSYRYWFCNYKL